MFVDADVCASSTNVSLSAILTLLPGVAQMSTTTIPRVTLTPIVNAIGGGKKTTVQFNLELPDGGTRTCSVDLFVPPPPRNVLTKIPARWVFNGENGQLLVDKKKIRPTLGQISVCSRDHPYSSFPCPCPHPHKREHVISYRPSESAPCEIINIRSKPIENLPVIFDSPLGDDVLKYLATVVFDNVTDLCPDLNIKDLTSFVSGVVSILQHNVDVFGDTNRLQRVVESALLTNLHARYVLG